MACKAASSSVITMPWRTDSFATKAHVRLCSGVQSSTCTLNLQDRGGSNAPGCRKCSGMQERKKPIGIGESEG